MKKLNLGCNYKYIKGFVNLDYDKKTKADIYHNLNRFPYPFKDNEFDYILASHILEHLDNPIKASKEITRILKPNGVLYLVVPHFTNPMAYAPVHRTYFSYSSIGHISNLHKIRSKIVFTTSFKFLEPIVNMFPTFYENSPLRIIQAKEIKVEFRKEPQKSRHK